MVVISGKLKIQAKKRNNDKMSKKNSDGTMPLIISYILIICGSIMIVLIFFDKGDDVILKWTKLLLGPLSLFLGIGGYRNRPKS